MTDPVPSVPDDSVDPAGSVGQPGQPGAPEPSDSSDAPALPSVPSLRERIRALTRPARLADGREADMLPLFFAQDIARTLWRRRTKHPRGRSVAQVERAALAMGVWPQRYLRNNGAYSLAEQLRLLESSVALLGLGGVGGYALELLARAGVGRIRAADGEEFDPSNLNRQLYATRRSLGGYKAAAAATRMRLVNPAVDFEPVALHVDEPGLPRLLAGVDLCLDALGGPAERGALLRQAGRAGLTVVTAAVWGQRGFVATVLPGGREPSAAGADIHDAAATTTTTAAMAATAASIMAGEALSILCGRGPALAGKMLAFDLSAMRFETVTL